MLGGVRIFRFPEVVDERAARVVATGVVGLALLYLASGATFLLALMALGFAARVASGPRFSPLARFATQVVVPRLAGPARPTAGAPKRFAQGIGALTSSAALAAALVGALGVAQGLVAVLVVAAGLESALGFCIGCRLYRAGVRLGLLDRDGCTACADLSRRSPRGVPVASGS
ncbi:MAG: DUF4395 domain-containing protein [Acidimicrobiia bacterium]|nr:DUF4395 domain-containing protein [Acidimicrobiia bacterium]